MELPVCYLVRDLDFKFSKRFDQVVTDAGVSVEPTAPRAHNQNAYVERWIQSIRYACLNRFLAIGLNHLDYLVSEFVDYYHDQRARQRKDNKPLLGVWSDANDLPSNGAEVICQEKLGGVLRCYERVAA